MYFLHLSGFNSPVTVSCSPLGYWRPLSGRGLQTQVSVGSHPDFVLDDGNSRLVSLRVVITEESDIEAILVEVLLLIQLKSFLCRQEGAYKKQQGECCIFHLERYKGCVLFAFEINENIHFRSLLFINNHNERKFNITVYYSLEGRCDQHLSV